MSLTVHNKSVMTQRMWAV